MALNNEFVSRDCSWTRRLLFCTNLRSNTIISSFFTWEIIILQSFRCTIFYFQVHATFYILHMALTTTRGRTSHGMLVQLARARGSHV